MKRYLKRFWEKGSKRMTDREVKIMLWGYAIGIVAVFCILMLWSKSQANTDYCCGDEFEIESTLR